MSVKFYRCNHCGNLLMAVGASGVGPVCCGEEMELLVAGSQDGAAEKHVPVVRAGEDAVRVEVGEVMHPMTPEHHIEWIVLECGNRIDTRVLEPGDGPVAVFPGGEHGTAYAYCNLHGLWEAAF